MRAWQSEKRMAHWTAALSLTGRWSSKVAHACLEPNCRRPKVREGEQKPPVIKVHDTSFVGRQYSTHTSVEWHC